MELAVVSGLTVRQAGLTGKRKSEFMVFKQIIKRVSFSTRDPVYYAASTLSDSSFYDTYDPFEYLTRQAERHDPSEEEEEEDAFADDAGGAAGEGGAVTNSEFIVGQSDGSGVELRKHQQNTLTPNRQNQVKKVRGFICSFSSYGA